LLEVLVLSDTHLNRPTPGLPEAITRAATGVDLIIHAGDFTVAEVYRQLGLLAPIEAVSGNMDEADLAARLPDKRLTTLEGVNIGIIHGSGSAKQALRRARAAFNQPDLIVFGHSHQPLREMMDGVLMFNPGSPTDRLRAPFRSYGIIEIEEGRFTTRIVPLDKRTPEWTSQMMGT